MDAALIADAQRVEHYEIAGYGCVHAYAIRLGDEEAAELLAETLEEEKAADKKLNDIAEELNLEVSEEGGEEEGEEVDDADEAVKSSAKRGRSKRVA
jgi:ferritin-like metal-binding protein YciE